MKVVIAIDSFKGCMTSVEANWAAAEGIRGVCPDAEMVQVPVSDGGLGYAFLQYLDAECKPGIELLLETIHFNDIVKDAYLVITGEGSADRQTLMGKLPMGILKQSGGVPVCLIAGKVSDKEQLLQAGFTHVECINPPGITLEEAMRKEVAMQHVKDTISCLLV